MTAVLRAVDSQLWKVVLLELISHQLKFLLTACTKQGLYFVGSAEQDSHNYLSVVFMNVYLINLFLQAASTPLSPLTFQCEFIKLRIDTLQALSQLICTCNSLKTSPPPAIATTIAITSGNDLQRCGRISVQVNC